MPDIFFLKKFVHATSRTFTFCVETASAFFVSRQRLCRPRCPELCDGPVLASNAKSGFNSGREGFVSSINPITTTLLSAAAIFLSSSS